MGVRGASKRQFALEELIDMPPPTREVPAWRLAPTRMERVVNLSPEELLDKIDQYFATTHEKGVRPTLCDLAGSTGFDSVQHLINHARRKGSATMRGLSRALTAVAAEYEELLQEGHKQAQFILQQIPQFDTDDAPATPPIKTFAPTVQIPVVIAGLARPEDTGNKMSEHEAYLTLIKNKTYQDAEVIDLALNEEGTYSGIDLEKLPED